MGLKKGYPESKSWHRVSTQKVNDHEKDQMTAIFGQEISLFAVELKQSRRAAWNRQGSIHSIPLLKDGRGWEKYHWGEKAEPVSRLCTQGWQGAECRFQGRLKR